MADSPEPSTPNDWPELEKFKARFREFVTERDWDRSHTPSPRLLPGSVARASRCRCGAVHRPDDGAGVVGTTLNRREGVHSTTADASAAAAGNRRKARARNLAMALAGEAGELLEQFQWLTPEESRNLPEETRERVAREIADIQIYLAALSDRLGIEIGPAVARKMALNAEKYPAEQVRGSARKYTELKTQVD